MAPYDSIVSAGNEAVAVIPYAEVGLHNHPDSAFAVYDGIVYDVTRFLRAHPGGRSILVPALGTDITDTLDSFHGGAVGRIFRSTEARTRYGIEVVGQAAPVEAGQRNWIGLHEYQSRREYSRPDPMAEELRRDVYEFLRRNGLSPRKTAGRSYALLVFFYILYGVAMWLAFIRGSAIASLLLGPIVTFMAVNVAHTVMHGGFADRKAINFFGKAIWDVVGYSSRCWDVEHQIHHQAPHSMIDLQTAGATVVRFFEHQEYRWYHRYQMFYIWFVFVLYSPNSWVIHTYNTLFKYDCVPRSEKITHVIGKTLGFALPIGLSFYLLDFGIAFRSLVLFALSKSYFSLFALFIQHEDSYLPEYAREPWSERQVVTSVTWHTNVVLQWFLGYFNHHTEHHLFPGLDPALYPKIQPLVMAACAKYGLRYKHVSLFELIASQVSAWRKFAHGWQREEAKADARA
jgi:linoleoyl-CoA desaturase